MGTADITRLFDQPSKHYVGVRLQRGRVVTDADFNERQLTELADVRATLLDIIGPAGTPDDGFRIFDPVSVDIGGEARVEFSIDAGVMYAGGLRFELDQVETARFQSDWLQQRPEDLAPWPLLSGTQTRTDLVYLEAFEETVTAREDRELLERALGGADTSTRRRLGHRVRVLADVAIESCDETRALLSTTYYDQCRYRIDPSTSALAPVEHSLRLQLEPLPLETASGPCPPCEPDPQGPFLGAGHRAIRVMVSVDNRSYTWGFDNGAPLHRVTIDPVGTVTFLDLPVDRAHFPRAGEVVEILGWSRLLPNAEKVATTTGVLTRAATALDPSTNTLVLEEPLAPDALVTSWPGHPSESELPGSEGLTYYLRVWDRGPIGETPPKPLLPIVSGAIQPLGQTGLGLRWSGDRGCPGDAWVIAHRPGTTHRVMPWVLAREPVPAAEPRRFVVPLALVTWKVEGTSVVVDRVHDCRARLRPLTCDGPCTFTVGGKGGPEAGNFSTVQAAIDVLPAEGGRICVMPGKHEGRFTLRDRSNVEIVGCGPRSRLVVAQQDTDTEPLGFLCDVQDVRIADLAIEPRGVAGLQVQEDEPGGTSDVVLERLVIQTAPSSVAQASPKSALELLGGERTRVRSCRLGMPRGEPSLHPVAFLSGRDVTFEDNVVECSGVFDDGCRAWGGVQLGGDALGVCIRGNTIRGGFGHGITLGSIIYDIARTTTKAVPVGCAAMTFAYGLDPRLSLEVLQSAAGELGTPEPSGVLDDVVIRDNLIEDQGGSGISVVAFWPLPTDGPPDALLGISRLRVEDNRIRRCLLETPLDVLPLSSLVMAGGGVCLGDVDGLRVVGNVIRDCAPNRAGCGLFAVHASEVVIEGNVIESVGVEGGTSVGAKGGIVLFGASPSVVSSEPIPAAVRVVGNRVQQPSGRALQATVVGGALIVTANELGSRGDDAPGPSLSPASLQVQAGRVNDRSGLCVDLTNGGMAYDYLTSLDIDDGGPPDPAVFDDGRILFTDNHVTLSWESRVARGPFLASVLLQSLDETAVVGNQLVAKLDGPALSDPSGWPALTLKPSFAMGDRLLTQLYAIGMTVKIDGNRITEGLTDALVSAVGIGVQEYSTMARLNHSTHCVIAGWIGSAFSDSNRVLNFELINPVAPSGGENMFCDPLRVCIDPLDGATFGSFAFQVELDCDGP
ncbi:DUF6519 domain-containing protein [Paraliomyxa miuraensis]|uniref:DUF6519 domain-containing protein n=1 Tax=Paraliomyxa miuraensis TaxID=376150 RepID=UPI0022529BB5|nr:DUF6519 domain-containing protein [Paraliomyxa miuraensis]MCX4247455.1 right-handed parallel beta-helix repeat-containing protein [Paraliomyxa miuraensis]